MSGSGRCAAAPNTAQDAQNATGTRKKFLAKGTRLLSGAIRSQRSGIPLLTAT